jgi:hypothetical protein
MDTIARQNQIAPRDVAAGRSGNWQQRLYFARLMHARVAGIAHACASSSIETATRRAGMIIRIGTTPSGLPPATCPASSMLEALDLLAGLVSLLSAWRFFLPIGLAFGTWAAGADLLLAGGPRLALLVLLLVAGVAVGARWQASHRRRLRRSFESVE